MVTIYMIKESAALRIQGSRVSAYREMYSLNDLGWKPVNKTAYERKKKEIRTPIRKGAQPCATKSQSTA